MDGFLKNYWYVAATSEELADKPLGRIILNVPIVLFREKVGELEPLTTVVRID